MEAIVNRRGKQPIIMALARDLGTLRLPSPQRKAFDEGRLTIISQFPESETRTTRETAHQRNRFIAALADEVVFAYVAPGGSLSQLSREVLNWQIPNHQIHS
jgi:predicted Rossmann fold nucleotide-binding protein DprA/Smf involved in DNA uptake